MLLAVERDLSRFGRFLIRTSSITAKRAEKKRIEEELRLEALRPDFQKVDALHATMLQAIESVPVRRPPPVTRLS